MKTKIQIGTKALTACYGEAHGCADCEQRRFNAWLREMFSLVWFEKFTDAFPELLDTKEFWPPEPWTVPEKSDLAELDPLHCAVDDIRRAVAADIQNQAKEETTGNN